MAFDKIYTESIIRKCSKAIITVEIDGMWNLTPGGEYENIAKSSVGSDDLCFGSNRILPSLAF